MKNVWFITAVCLLLNGCYIGHGRFTVLCNKPVNMANLQIDQVPIKTHAWATSTYISALNIVFASGPTLDQSMDKVLEKNESDIIKNARLRTTIVYIPLILTIIGWETTGDTYQTNH